MPVPIEWIIGPVGALALALWVANALWQDHKRSDERDRKRATDAEDRLDKLLAKLRQPR